MKRIYQSKHYQELDTYVSVNGTKRLVQFRGGSLKPKVNGKFSTTDPALIAAMDKDAARPGASYKVILKEDDPAPAPVKEDPAPPAPPAPEPEDPETPPKDTTDENPKTLSAEDVKTFHQARKFLTENIEGLTNGMLPNMIAIKEMAAKHNIVFPNLP